MQIGVTAACTHHAIDDLAPSNIHKSAHYFREITHRQKRALSLWNLSVVSVAPLDMTWHAYLTRVSVIARQAEQMLGEQAIKLRRNERCGISLLPLRKGGTYARKRLYCLPYAGGSAGIFRSWPALLSPDIDIWGVEYPGHGSRMGEPLVDCVERLADLTADAVAAENGTPYALFGHSMGSLVAFETCHKLAARRARTPELLVVSGHRAPHLPPSTPPLHAAPDSEFIAHLRELGATPPEVLGSPELLDLMLPILRSDFRACETYVPSARSPLRTAIAVYGGLADEDTSCASLRAWSCETTGACTVRMFPGGHFFLRDSASKFTAMLEHDLANAFKMHRAESRAPEMLRHFR